VSEEQPEGTEGAREPNSPSEAPTEGWGRPAGPASSQPVQPSQPTHPVAPSPQIRLPHSPPYPYPYPPAGPVAVPPYPPPPYPPHQGVRAPAPAPGSTPPRIEPVPGTQFGLAYFSVPPTISGQAIGSMVAGILSILVSLVVGCFGLAGAQQGWGPIVGGAFAVLAAVAGLAALALGLFSVRQVTRSGGRLAGRGMAITGISCGAAGLALTAVAMVLALSI
jgi:hypothetical protein